MLNYKLNKPISDKYFFALAILLLCPCLYDFLLIYNYDLAGGYSIDGSVFFFHSRPVRELLINYTVSMVLYFRFLTIKHIKRHWLNVFLLVFFLVLISAEVIIKKNYISNHILNLTYYLKIAMILIMLCILMPNFRKSF